MFIEKIINRARFRVVRHGSFRVGTLGKTQPTYSYILFAVQGD
jgi:hypothetical protein